MACIYDSIRLELHNRSRSSRGARDNPQRWCENHKVFPSGTTPRSSPSSTDIASPTNWCQGPQMQQLQTTNPHLVPTAFPLDTGFSADNGVIRFGFTNCHFTPHPFECLRSTTGHRAADLTERHSPQSTQPLTHTCTSIHTPQPEQQTRQLINIQLNINHRLLLLVTGLLATKSSTDPTHKLDTGFSAASILITQQPFRIKPTGHVLETGLAPVRDLCCCHGLVTGCTATSSHNDSFNIIHRCRPITISSTRRVMTLRNSTGRSDI